VSAESTSLKRARVALTVSKDSMSATVILRTPQEGDPPITVQEVLEELESKEVVFGIDHAAIERMVTNLEYNSPVNVAVGRRPEKGANSGFIYHFSTEKDHRPKEDSDGHIDYRDIDFIQNTETGKLLVTKVPAMPGKPGINVRGKEIKGADGRDLPFNAGQNTKESDDGLSLYAATGGVIQFQHGRVSVCDVLVIKGNVDHTVGNLNVKGSLRVQGDVKAGFEIKVEGDIEVNGKVEDSNLEAGGNIYVKGGFFGQGNGVMKAGGDITLKFAEGQRIESGHHVYIGGEAINCTIEAADQVVVKGKKGKIIGGSVKAGKVIRAAELGSEAGSATNLTVAYDPELMARYWALIKEMQRIKEDGDRVKEALYGLYRLQIDGKLPPEKKAVLDKFEQFQRDLPANIKELLAQKKVIEEEIAKNNDAVIIAEETLHSGVKASFGIVYREILEEYKRCKLTLEGNKVMVSDFKGD